MKTYVLGESRRDGKTVLLELLQGETGKAYRVTIAQRYPSLTKAQAAFLSETPPSLKQFHLKQIAESKKGLQK